MSNDNKFSSPKMRLLQIDATHLAVPEDRVTAVIDWTSPATLPFAPTSVLGIVCIYGRMFTLIDPRALLEGEAYIPSASRNLIVALQGDEQLALAVDVVSDSIEIQDNEIGPAMESCSQLCVGSFSRNGSKILKLDPDAIFSHAMRGRERRRRRI